MYILTLYFLVFRNLISAEVDVLAGHDISPGNLNGVLKIFVSEFPNLFILEYQTG